MALAQVTVAWFNETGDFEVVCGEPGSVNPPDRIIFGQTRAIRSADDRKRFVDDFVDKCRSFSVPLSVVESLDHYLDRVAPASPD